MDSYSRAVERLGKMDAPVGQINPKIRSLLLPYLQQVPSIMEKTSLMEGIIAFWSKKKDE
jgi:hypothetical protein